MERFPFDADRKEAWDENKRYFQWQDEQAEIWLEYIALEKPYIREGKRFNYDLPE